MSPIARKTRDHSLREVLQTQTKYLIDILREVNRKRGALRPKADYVYIENFFNKVIDERNARADIIDDPEHDKALHIAHKLFPYPMALEMCMDGRLFGPLLGIYGHVGKVLTVAGGILHEFVRNEDNQKMYLLPKSNFAKLVEKNFEETGSKIFVEILDSHVACAAREGEEIAKGKFPVDHGLMHDVMIKKEMRDALIDFVEKRFRGRKKIIPIQTSMDVKNGFMYMG
ncbi:MAG: hypothetical protein ACREGI_02985, partial [Candidatus Levyibacteriota bacterium]